MRTMKAESSTRRAMRLHEALEYPCPYCGAKPLEFCSTAKGEDTYEHTARLILRNFVEGPRGPERSDKSRVARFARKLRAAATPPKS